MKCGRSRPGVNVPPNSSYRAPVTLAGLASQIPSALQHMPVYSYIVTTIKTTSGGHLVQTGSAPNFDGGRITLCTCKHKDRATMWLSADKHDPWKDVWVAGFTSASGDPSRAFAYLMLVEQSFLSQWALWQGLRSDPVCRLAKSACRSILGDLYEPRRGAAENPHDPRQFHPPISGHVHASGRWPNSWHSDIERWKWKKPHRLLLGSREHSFRWTTAELILKPGAVGATAHHKQFGSLDDLVAQLLPYVP